MFSKTMIALSITFVLGAASAATALYPRPVVSVLGHEWQCKRIVFLTSCTRVEQIQPVAERLGKSAPPRGV